MKIAMIGSRGIPVTYSGIETQLQEICPRLVKMGHQVEVYCKRKMDFKGLGYQGVRLTRLPSIDTKHMETFSRSFLATIRELFSSNDVVHFHALGPSVFSVLPRMFWKKTAVTVHGLDWRRAKWGKVATGFLRFGEWTSCHFPNAVITVSKTLKHYYESKYGIGVHYVPNGVNIPDILPPHQITEDFQLEKNGYVLFLSRLVPEKGCHYLIEAFKRVNTPMKLVIAGGGGYTDSYVKSLKELAADDSRIIFTGFVKGRLLEELYSNAYLYVLPSEIEGLPIALLEALSYNNCVLASNIPENMELLNGNGFVFNAKDTLDLQQKLIMLLESPSLVLAKKQKSRKYVENHFIWDKISEQMEDIYLNITEKTTNKFIKKNVRFFRNLKTSNE